MWGYYKDECKCEDIIATQTDVELCFSRLGLQELQALKGKQQ